MAPARQIVDVPGLTRGDILAAGGQSAEVRSASSVKNIDPWWSWWSCSTTLWPEYTRGLLGFGLSVGSVARVEN